MKQWRKSTALGSQITGMNVSSAAYWLFDLGASSISLMVFVYLFVLMSNRCTRCSYKQIAESLLTHSSDSMGVDNIR